MSENRWSPDDIVTAEIQSTPPAPSQRSRVR